MKLLVIMFTMTTYVYSSGYPECSIINPNIPLTECVTKHAICYLTKINMTCVPKLQEKK